MMRMWTTYHPNGEFYTWAVSYQNRTPEGVTHYDHVEHKTAIDAGLAAARWILDNL